MVGTPVHRFRWILSRTPQLGDVVSQSLVERARQPGFPVSDLIRAPRHQDQATFAMRLDMRVG